VGAVVLPCVLFYRSPLSFSRSAHRLATGRYFFQQAEKKLETIPILLL
jgi:hypothetical protein